MGLQAHRNVKLWRLDPFDNSLGRPSEGSVQRFDEESTLAECYKPLHYVLRHPCQFGTLTESFAGHLETVRPSEVRKLKAHRAKNRLNGGNSGIQFAAFDL